MLGVHGSDLHWVLPGWAANSSLPNPFNILASDCHCSPFVQASVVLKETFLSLVGHLVLCLSFWVVFQGWCLAHILPLSFWSMLSFRAKAASSAVSVSSAIFSTFSVRLSFPRFFKFFLVSLRCLPFGKVAFLLFDKVAFLPFGKVAFLPFDKVAVLEEAAALWPSVKVALLEEAAAFWPFDKASFSKPFFTFMFFLVPFRIPFDKERQPKPFDKVKLRTKAWDTKLQTLLCLKVLWQNVGGKPCEKVLLRISQP